MTIKTARRRYINVLIPSMIIYFTSLFAMSWAEDKGLISGPILYVLTLIPIGAIFSWVWSHWRFVNELDEYLRGLHTHAMMIGLMIILAISGGWGLMELMANVPKIPIFYILPAFYLINAIAFKVLAKRAGMKGMCP